MRNIHNPAILFISTILFACAAKPEHGNVDLQAFKELEQLQTELSVALKAPAIKQIKYRVVTDLQFEMGCRQQGIPVEKCDYQNTLSVDFEEFNCRSNINPNDPFTSLQGIKDGGVRCNYKGQIYLADGRTKIIEKKAELYKLEYYSDGISHEYMWERIRE